MFVYVCECVCACVGEWLGGVSLRKETLRAKKQPPISYTTYIYLLSSNNQQNVYFLLAKTKI